MSVICRPILPPRQRRLQHFRGITVRNLKPKLSIKMLLDSYFSLHLIGTNGEKLGKKFYTSEIAVATLNPSWQMSNEINDNQQEIEDVTDFTFRLFIAKTQELVVECSVCLRVNSNLQYIGNELSRLPFQQQYNVIIFELVDGYYVSEDTIRREFGDSLNYREASFKPVQGYSKENMQKIVKYQRLLKQVSYEKKAVSMQIETKLLQQKDVLLQQEKKESYSIRIAKLRKDITTSNELLQADRKFVQQIYSEILPKAKALQRSQATLIQSKRELIEHDEQLWKQKKEIKLIAEEVRMCKYQIIKDLHFIFPIRPTSQPNMLTINGVLLPTSDFAGFDEERISTALGFVCHLVVMLAFYLDIPLRYPITPMCSRSFIIDEILQHQVEKFPLYSRGVDRTRFEYAFYLLNKNVEQLLNSNGLTIVSLKKHIT